MASEPKEVKLYATWASSYCVMVQNALKIKGVAFEWVEEDLQNKSADLLRLNPVHKKVPVLAVDGRPVAESLVILEYADEVWRRGEQLLPPEPHARAMARFWAKFIYDKAVPLSYTVMLKAGEEQAKAVNELKEQMIILEKGIQKDFPGAAAGGPFVHGQKPGFLDVVLGSCATGIKVMSAIAGKEPVEQGQCPRLRACLDAFEELSVEMGTSVPYDRLLALSVERRETALATSA